MTNLYLTEQNSILRKSGDRLIVQKEDSVRIYTLCANCEKIVDIIGTGEATQDKDVYII